MLQEAIDLQKKAVSNLIAITEAKREITFKAPTGSGKTYMMADYMNQILEKNQNVIFLVSSLSKGDLAIQNYEKFVEYSNDGKFKNIKPYLISSESAEEERLYIPTDSNVYLLPRDLYKNTSKLKQGALSNFLYVMTLKKPLGKEKEVYLIKDECHIATNNLDSLAEQYFKKILNFSATPKLSRGQNPDVEIAELDAIHAKLIKSVSYHSEEESLEEAICQFESIKEKYHTLLGMNPCMIIQISNKEKAEEELEEIFHTLKNHQNLKWMLIVDKEKECDTNDVFKAKKMPVKRWKDYAKTNMATIDIIIFKMVITEGWDIPRACMLYQIRDSKSKQLDEQVIGRVRRNPRLLDYETLTQEQKELVTKAFVWGNIAKETKRIYEVNLTGNKEINEIQTEIQIKTTRLKRPTEYPNFDLNQFMKKKEKKLVPTSVFELYHQYAKMNHEVKEMFETYVDSYQKWFTFMENLDEIAKESKDMVCDYTNNMEITKNEKGQEVYVSFPLVSYYVDNGHYKNLHNWVWQKTNQTEEFSFDSQAEKEWIEILTDLIAEDAPTGEGRLVKDVTITQMNTQGMNTQKKYLIGKNYLTNSEIKFEYYLKGIHVSYPDFVMKDHKNRIHLFEVKSLNESHSYQIEKQEYEEKIKALKDCYRQSSKLTEYYFYIPIKKDEGWTIYQFYQGKETLLSKNEWIQSIRTSFIQ